MENKFFSFDDSEGFQMHPSAQAAKNEALRAIDEYRDHESGIWYDDVKNVCWGIIFPMEAPIPHITSKHLFSLSEDIGFKLHDNIDDAIKTLFMYDGSIYGMIMEKSTETDKREATPEDRDRGIDFIIDYNLVAPE